MEVHTYNSTETRARHPLPLVFDPLWAHKERYRYKRILAVVAKVHKLRRDEIEGRCRTNRVSRARFHVIAILRAFRPDLTINYIGRLVGRDHSTVLYAIRQWPNRAT